MSSKLIAVINDDTAFLRLMDRLLRQEGYRTIAWFEGDSAYEMVHREQPDLVILDLRLDNPETGWMVAELLRLDPTTTHIPIIVCSADAVFLREKEQILREKGCDILEKPFDLQDLLEKVMTAIGPAAPEGAERT